MALILDSKFFAAIKGLSTALEILYTALLKVNKGWVHYVWVCDLQRENFLELCKTKAAKNSDIFNDHWIHSSTMTSKMLHTPFIPSTLEISSAMARRARRPLTSYSTT